MPKPLPKHVMSYVIFILFILQRLGIIPVMGTPPNTSGKNRGSKARMFVEMLYSGDLNNEHLDNGNI